MTSKIEPILIVTFLACLPFVAASLWEWQQKRRRRAHLEKHHAKD